MREIAIHLGWIRVLTTDEAGLKALQDTCRALAVRTRWDAAGRVLHLESPVEGRRVALSADAALSPVADAAWRALASAGAEAPQGGPADAAVHLVAAEGAGGTAGQRPPQALYIAGGSGQSRRLALALADAAHAHRCTLQVRRDPAPARGEGPRVHLCLPPGASAEPWAMVVAEGIMRHLAPPDLVRLLDRLGRRRLRQDNLAASAAVAALLFLAEAAGSQQGDPACHPPARAWAQGPLAGPSPAAGRPQVAQGAGGPSPAGDDPEPAGGRDVAAPPPRSRAPGAAAAGGQGPAPAQPGARATAAVAAQPRPDPFRPPGAGQTFTFRVIGAGASPFAVTAGPAHGTPAAHATVVSLPPMEGGEERRAGGRRARPWPRAHWVRSW